MKELVNIYFNIVRPNWLGIECSVEWLRAVAEGTRLFNISSLNYLIYGWLIAAYLGGSISCGAQHSSL